MGILSFAQNRRSGNQVGNFDWNQQEIADFYRACNLLQQNGVAIGIDRGLTDIGEPWVAFYETGTHDVFIHVARIKGECVLVCERLEIKLSAPSISRLIDKFEEAVRGTVAVRGEQNSNVVLHPAARMIFSLAAVFLIFKIEAADVAYAKTGSDGSFDQNLRKHDAALHARVQNVLVRLQDVVDMPTAIAAFASILIAYDISASRGVEIDVALAEVEAGAREASLATGLVTREVEGATHEEIVVVATNEIANDAISAASPELLVDLIVAPTLTMVAGPDGLETDRAVSLRLPPPAADAREKSQSAETSTSEVEVVPVEDVSGSITEVSGGLENLDEVGEIALSLQVLEAYFSFADLEASQTGLADLEILGAGSGQPVVIVLNSGDDVLTEPLADEYGFAAITELHMLDLGEALKIFMGNIDRYDVVFEHGDVVVEDLAVSGLAKSEVGIWTNVMSDGSSISIVGLVDMIDDIEAFIV